MSEKKAEPGVLAMERHAVITVAQYSGVTQERFLQEIYPLRKPAVLKGIDLGPCTSKWTVDYLSQTVGSKEVKVHVSAVPQMDFLTLLNGFPEEILLGETPDCTAFRFARAFERVSIGRQLLRREEAFTKKVGDPSQESELWFLRLDMVDQGLFVKNWDEKCPCEHVHMQVGAGTLPFDVFVKRAAEAKHAEYFISEDEKYYLRSLGEDPRKDIADLRRQFPLLADDIWVPEYFEKEQLFSTVFRIGSAGLQLWTHYDVMDNFLIQVTGKKRVVLYSPRDAPYLYLSGSKSEVLDVDMPNLKRYPLFAKAKRYECLLNAGEVLFIPALWFHNVTSEEFGVGVNVFWKHLPAECYDKTDTYGNKDLAAASRATQILDRALKTLDELPEEYKDFYGRKMVLRIQEKTYSTNYE